MTATPLSPRAAVAVGTAVSGMGVLIVLLAVGIIPGAEASLEAPRWVVATAGLAFVLAGAAVIVGYAVAGGAAPDGDLPPGTPRWVRITQSLLGLGIIVSLAAAGTPSSAAAPATRPSAGSPSASARC